MGEEEEDGADAVPTTNVVSVPDTDRVRTAKIKTAFIRRRWTTAIAPCWPAATITATRAGARGPVSRRDAETSREVRMAERR